MDNKKKIIVIVAIIAIAILLVVAMSNKGNSEGNNSGQIANFGDKLVINEKADKFNIKVLTEPAKHTVSDSILGDGEYIKIKVAIENLDTSDLSLGGATIFSLVDSSKNEIAINSVIDVEEDSIIGKTIASGDEMEGYMYFYDDSSDDENGEYTIDYAKINNIKYLKVSVISDAKESSDGKIKISRKDYYLEIK